MLDQAKHTTLLIKSTHPPHYEGVAIPECWQLVLDHARMTSSTHATPCRETDEGTIDTT